MCDDLDQLTIAGPTVPDDDPDVVAGMERLKQLRAAEQATPEPRFGDGR